MLWDVRRPNSSVMVGILPERAYAADCGANLVVVAMAERKVSMFDLRASPPASRHVESTLKYQLRSIACMPDQSGYIVGSIEGRCAIEFLSPDEQRDSRSFMFKCHRNNQEIYAVNSISFNTQFSTFATAGSDGSFHFWDYRNKSRTKAFGAHPQPISAAAFSPDSNFYAFSQSYDWSRGSVAHNPAAKNSVHVMAVATNDIKPRR